MMRTILTVLLAATCTAFLQAQDWTQWRGPSRTGYAAAFKPPASWPEKATKAWQVQAGEGHSSPVVSGSRAYLHSRVGDLEAITAYDIATGKPLWRDTYAAPYEMNSAARSHGKGPKSTPVIDRGRLFTFGISGIVSAYDLTGAKLLWRKEFKEFPKTSPDFGTAMSPIVEGINLIVHAGGPGSGAIVALDVSNGSQRWAWKGDGPAYASPIIVSIDGTRQLITETQSNIVALSPADGKLLWRTPFTTEYDQNIVTAVTFEGLLIYSGVNKPLTAVRVAQAGGKWTATPAWQNADLPMYMTSPVERGGVLYGLTERNRGQFFAADARSGKTLWTTRGREGENAALVLSGDVVIATTTEGELVVFKRDPSAFTLVRKYTIADSPVWAHPAPAGKGILIKDASTLAYWTF
jgi:outer membrane protein assembly factor BamB